MKPTLNPAKSATYGWLIVACGMLIIVAVLGFGRFALGMLLPSMGSELQLGYDQMGFISTGNFIGYLFAVFISSRLIDRFGYRKVISTATFIVGCSLILIGFSKSFPAALIAFFIAGMGSGAANVPVMSLISHWFLRSMRGRAAGFVVSGSGIGIMLTGIIVPYINNTFGESGWRLSWVLLGCMCLLIAAFGWLLIRNHPEDMGLTPLGHNLDQEVEVAKTNIKLSGQKEKVTLLHLGAIYFLFGFTYVIYVTFVITTLISEFGFTESIAGKFWFWFGLIGIGSGPLFGTLSDSIGRAKTLALVFLLQSAAHLLLAWTPGLPGIYISIFLFGICAWSVPSIMAATVGDCMGPARAAKAFGSITLLFGIGQISGPALAGILAENSGSFASSYQGASFLALAAAALSTYLHRTIITLKM